MNGKLIKALYEILEKERNGFYANCMEMSTHIKKLLQEYEVYPDVVVKIDDCRYSKDYGCSSKYGHNKAGGAGKKTPEQRRRINNSCAARRRFLLSMGMLIKKVQIIMGAK